ncbi:MAG: LytTR family DNA-binding domain-containing protein [Rudaea sp.]
MTDRSNTSPRTLLDRYQPYRRWVEAGFWIAVYVVETTINSLVAIMDNQRMHAGFANWQLFSWEWSSHLVSLALVPAIIWFSRQVPLRYGTLRRHVPLHALASIVYCTVHVAGMVALRKLDYAWHGQHYDFGNWPHELFYEYLKDWRTYVGVLLVVAAYRLLLLRLQGEARLLDAPDEGIDPHEPIERPDRFLVRKLGKEFLVAANDVEYLQACGNYVNLHVRGRDYPLRTTMAGIEPRLDPSRFVRVHRSWMVNLDCIAEIEPLDTGDARLRMHDGATLPCSRRYRAALKR